MMHLGSNRKAVANVLGYVFSFSVISLIMSFSVLTTTSIIDTKSHEAAALEAQNIANQIADAIVNAVSVAQSMPQASYYDIVSLPEDLAGYSYYISVDDYSVYVYTKDGEVHKSCLNYNTKHLDFDIRGDITGGEEGIAVSYQSPKFIYKLDFGKGNGVDSKSHSPVKTGYYLVTENSIYDPEQRQPAWWEGTIATPEDGNPGGLYAFDAAGEPYTFKDSETEGTQWQYDEDTDEVVSYDPDLDAILIDWSGDPWIWKLYAVPGDGDLGGLYALDDDGEPYIFKDINGNWVYDSWDTIPPPPKYLDPDGDGINAQPQIGQEGGLYYVQGNEMDYSSKPYTFKDSDDDWEYDDGELVVEPNPDRYNHKYRIPIRIENPPAGDGGSDLVDVPIKIVLSHNDIDINRTQSMAPTNFILFLDDRYPWINFVFFIDENGQELPFCVEYFKESGGASEAFKENIVFLVNITIAASETKYIYFYYGSDSRSDNHVSVTSKSDVALFYDDFSSNTGWDKTYCRGGDDVAYSVARDSYNFIYVVGSGTNLKGLNTGKDWWIKKFDINGYERDERDGWQEELAFHGGKGDDEALSVATYGDDVYVVGYGTWLVGPGNTKMDWWIKKFDRYGGEYGDETPDDPLDEGWDKKIDSGYKDDEAHSVATDNSGNVYVVGYGTKLVAGYSDRDWWIKKFNENGEEQPWNSPELDRNDGPDEARSVALDSNGDVYVVGYCTDADDKDWWIKKFDSSGTEYEEGDGWNKTIDSGNGPDEALSVAVDNHNNVYVAGYVTNAGGNKDWGIKKFDLDGNELSFVPPIDSGNGDDEALSVMIDTKTGIRTYNDGELLELDPDGQEGDASPVEWQYGGLYALQYGGLYALDDGDGGLRDPEPYVFLDNGNWVYGGETVKYYDPDNNGENAVPKSGDLGGLFAFDSAGAEYTFKDLDGDWTYDVDELVESDPYNNGGSSEGDRGEDPGGLYALDEQKRPYTFEDKNDVYVAGYKTDADPDKDWYIKKFNSTGNEEWTSDKQTYDAGISGGSSIRSMAIDGWARIYIAGDGTDLDDEDGIDTDKDWLIKKLSSEGYDQNSYLWGLKSSINSGTWSIPYEDVANLIYSNRGGGRAKLWSTSSKNYFITSKDFGMESPDESLYIVEMKLKLSNNRWDMRGRPSLFYGGMVLLNECDPSTGEVNYSDSYVVSVDNYNDPDEGYGSEPDYSYFNLTKYISGVDPLELESKKMPLLRAADFGGEGLLMRSYVHLDPSLPAATINSYLHHPSTFAPYGTSVAGTDALPIDLGRIGLVSFYPGISGQRMYVDWIRVLKSTSVQPTVTIGTMESINYGWEWPAGSSPGSDDRNSDPFCTDPLHNDFIDVPIREFGQASKLNITYLDPGRYIVILTVGDKENNEDPCQLSYNIKKHSDTSFDPNSWISVPDGLPETTGSNRVKRVWFTIDIPEDYGDESGDLCIAFFREDGDDGFYKAVSSVTVEDKNEPTDVNIINPGDFW